MITVNIHEAKTKLSQFIQMVSCGESVIICNRGTPVVELKAITPPQKGKRPIGLARKDYPNWKPNSDCLLEPIDQETLDAMDADFTVAA